MVWKLNYWQIKIYDNSCNSDFMNLKMCVTGYIDDCIAEILNNVYLKYTGKLIINNSNDRCKVNSPYFEPSSRLKTSQL